jgi:TPR repeat protein
MQCQVTKIGYELEIFKMTVLGLMLWNPVIADAQTYGNIFEAESAGDFESAIDMLTELAEQGDAHAQKKLGTMLANHGRWVDLDQAVSLPL